MGSADLLILQLATSPCTRSPLAREFGRRIYEAIDYQSSAVASAIDGNLEDAIDAGSITVADVLAIVGVAELAEFDWLLGLPVRAGRG
ncbi:hypothetical protein QUA71_25695 [Microcoleus sp. MON1_C5]|uniref:hypothetical protein n=1 Tax=Microcoleus sp. MON1_C5 TaxID=2818828 RepID=UPI002FD4AFFE